MKNKTVVLNEHLSEEYKQKFEQNPEKNVEELNKTIPEDFGFDVKNVKAHNYSLVFTVVIVLVIVIGLTMVIWGAVSSSIQGKPHGKYSQQIFAEVNSVYLEKNKKGELEYYPELNYVIDNKNYTVKVEKGLEEPTYSDGQQVEIIYNPDNPEDFIILSEDDGQSGKSLVSSGLILMAFGFFAIIIKSKLDS